MPPEPSLEGLTPIESEMAEEAWKLMFQIPSVYAFGNPPGLEWAEQVAAIADSVAADMQRNFPATSEGLHVWARPPLLPP